MEPVHKEIIQTSDDSYYIVLKQLDKWKYLAVNAC